MSLQFFTVVLVDGHELKWVSLEERLEQWDLRILIVFVVVLVGEP